MAQYGIKTLNKFYIESDYDFTLSTNSKTNYVPIRKSSISEMNEKLKNIQLKCNEEERKNYTHRLKDDYRNLIMKNRKLYYLTLNSPNNGTVKHVQQYPLTTISNSDQSISNINDCKDGNEFTEGNLEKILIENLLNQRLKSIIKIQNIFKVKLFQKKLKTLYLMKKILISRSEKVVLLQKNIKGFLCKKSVKHVLKMIKENCVIYYYCNEEENKIHTQKLNLLVKEGASEKIYNFIFNQYLDCFLLFFKKLPFFPRTKFKINFILNNKLIIDTHFPVSTDTDGRIYNILDFKTLRARGCLSNIDTTFESELGRNDILNNNNEFSPEANYRPRRKMTFPPDNSKTFINEDNFLNYNKKKKLSFSYLIKY